jgi:hypothetical protein
MKLEHALLATPLALALACGGASDGANPTTGGTSAALTAAAPAFSALSIDQVSADATGSAVVAAAPAPSALAAATSAAAPVVNDLTCHPHLFLRQREVVERVNRHIYKALQHVELAIARGDVSATATSMTWDRVEGSLERKFTVTWISASVYGWELDVGPAGGALQTAMTGQIDRTGATGPHRGKGTMHVDFGALHAGYPAEQVTAGTLDVQFDSEATARTLAVAAKDVTWALDAMWLDEMPAVLAALSAPRSGAYVYYRAPGKGGSLKLQDQMVFACPSNPSLVAADAQLVSRWVRATDGSVHGRSDALMTGGQLTAPVDHVAAVTCHSAAAEEAMHAEGFWFMKAEAADGTTVKSWPAVEPPSAAACDPIFGPMPDAADAANDFTAWPTSYSDGVPYPLPQ